MPFPYSFTTPNEVQLQKRHHLLDTYGQIAQISALLPLFASYIPFLVRYAQNKYLSWRDSRQGKEHASPVQARFDTQAKPSDTILDNRWSRRREYLRWDLDQEVFSGWGTWRILLTALLWTTWLFLLAISDTGDDYLHLTKRFGIIGASQLPLHYLLAVKSSWSPISYITGLSHEELNPYHRALGRIVLVFFSLHASFYLNFYVQKSLLLKRIQDRDVILGLLAISSFLTIGTTALARVRERNYFLFFVIHVVLSISLLPILYFHVSHLRVYIVESAVIYIVLILQRNVSQKKVSDATVSRVDGTSNLISIQIPLTSALSQKTFHPGQHIYLSIPSGPPQDKLRLNPFTIANLPQKDNHIRLVIRALNGTTNILSNLISPAEEMTKTTLAIEGPYGAAASFSNLLKYDRVLLAAGGVGATFTLPLYRRLVDQGFDLQGLWFTWSVRRLEDAQWAFPHLGEGCAIHVTGFAEQTSHPKSNSKHNNHRATDYVNADNEAIELQEREGLMNNADHYSSDAADRVPRNVVLRRGRPDYHFIVSQVFAPIPISSGDVASKVAVLVCGPPGMAAALRGQIGWYVGKGNLDVWWHNEEFGW